MNDSIDRYSFVVLERSEESQGGVERYKQFLWLGHKMIEVRKDTMGW